MSIADLLNAVGLGATGVGSVLGMAGILKQTNAYYPFRPWQLVGHMFEVAVRCLFTRSAFGEVSAAAKLTAKREEDRAKSLVGLYFVFFGFVLQLFGASLLFAGVFATSK